MAVVLALFEKLLSFFCTLFGLVLGLIIVLICVDVALRDLGLGSLPWLIELSEYLMWEYPIARLYADARVQKIYGGTNEIMKELIGRTL